MFKGEMAAHYDAWYQTARGRFIDQVETAAALPWLTASPHGQVLDAGCGTGNFSLKLARMGYEVTGIDISPDMLDIARSKAIRSGYSIRFLKMDLTGLDFPDHSFDKVLSMAAWEFVPDPQRGFAELWRVLKPGGSLIIGTINRDSAWGRLYLQQASSPDSVFRFAHFKSPDDLRNLDREHFMGWGECLFIPPTAEDDSFTTETEARLRATEAPGFMVAAWKKAE